MYVRIERPRRDVAILTVCVHAKTKRVCPQAESTIRIRIDSRDNEFSYVSYYTSVILCGVVLVLWFVFQDTWFCLGKVINSIETTPSVVI